MNLALSTDDRIDMLREENRQLRDRIARLEGGDDIMRARKAFGTSVKQSQVICYLVARGEARRDLLLDHCYSFDQQVSYTDVSIALACLIKHVRKRLRARGVEFQTVYQLGWIMDDQNRARARQIMEAGPC